ncbi:MAG: DUF4190 domain-containing protein [Dehalococcoidales bacterium]|nr:DUF4190 domain-containing protein [Dehalococcoidales bacterium]
MFCSKCGEKNPANSKFCSKCGEPLNAVAAPAEASAPRAATGTRTSGMAIAALIMGILGISILAIIFGGIGISQTGKDPNLKGKGMAVAGLVLGILGMIGVIVWILAAIFWSTSFWWFI